MTDKEIDHSCTDTAICPYCGHDNGDGSYSGEGPPKGVQQCYECEKYFDCEPSYSVTFYTSKLDCRNGSEHEWHLNDYTKDMILKKILRRCRSCNKTEWVDV